MHLPKLHSNATSKTDSNEHGTPEITSSFPPTTSNPSSHENIQDSQPPPAYSVNPPSQLPDTSALLKDAPPRKSSELKPGDEKGDQRDEANGQQQWKRSGDKRVGAGMALVQGAIAGLFWLLGG
ncbi:Nn.00g062160.m01.CDS01 [Neocucurbitaria sp. VM-36]